MGTTISASTVRRWLLAGWAVIITLGLAAEVFYYVLEANFLGLRVDFFSLSYEKNIPTWYSSSLHLLAGVLLAVIAAGKRQSGAPFVRSWWILSLIFVYISIDELVSIHENWGGWTDVGGIFYFDWVIPASILVILFVAGYLRFLLHLPPRTRDAFVLAGAVFVGGALGVEFFLGYWTDARGSHNLGYALIDFVEESLEILGISLFILALFRYAGDERGELQVGAPSAGHAAKPAPLPHSNSGEAPLPREAV